MARKTFTMCLDIDDFGELEPLDLNNDDHVNDFMKFIRDSYKYHLSEEFPEVSFFIEDARRVNSSRVSGAVIEDDTLDEDEIFALEQELEQQIDCAANSLYQGEICKDIYEYLTEKEEEIREEISDELIEKIFDKLSLDDVRKLVVRINEDIEFREKKIQERRYGAKKEMSNEL